jgi:hypothetical protein
VLPRPTVAATRTPPSALPCPWGSLSPMVAGAALATQAHTFSYYRCCFVCCRGLCLLTGWAFELVKVNGGGGVCIFFPYTKISFHLLNVEHRVSLSPR